jgi:hypothetical protein
VRPDDPAPDVRHASPLAQTSLRSGPALFRGYAETPCWASATAADASSGSMGCGGEDAGRQSAYPTRLSMNADMPALTLCAMYGRRPRCKGKESDLFAKRSGAAMYSAFECSRCGCWP